MESLRWRIENEPVTEGNTLVPLQNEQSNPIPRSPTRILKLYYPKQGKCAGTDLNLHHSNEQKVHKAEAVCSFSTFQAAHSTEEQKGKE